MGNHLETSLTTLSASWRAKSNIQGFGKGYSARSYVESCANQLDELLPRWTKITDNPRTWPGDSPQLMFFNPHTSKSWIELKCDAKKRYKQGLCWRPLCSIDVPPDVPQPEADESEFPFHRYWRTLPKISCPLCNSEVMIETSLSQYEVNEGFMFDNDAAHCAGCDNKGHAVISGSGAEAWVEWNE